MGLLLEHSNVPYNPAKAHEYYLRTRHLKGRRPGQGQVVPTRGPHFTKVMTPSTVTAKSPEQQSKEIEQKVAALKIKLDHLKKFLAELVRQAKARSGVKAAPRTSHNKASSSSKKSASNGGKTPLTGAQKQKARIASKKYAQKHKNDPNPASDQVKALELSIKQVEEKIAKAQAQLKASVERARKTINFTPAPKP